MTSPGSQSDYLNQDTPLGDKSLKARPPSIVFFKAILVSNAFGEISIVLFFIFCIQLLDIRKLLNHSYKSNLL